jgi:hypothetical protein
VCVCACVRPCVRVCVVLLSMVTFPLQVVADQEKQQAQWQAGAQWQGWQDWQRSSSEMAHSATDTEARTIAKSTAARLEELQHQVVKLTQTATHERSYSSSESLFTSANNMRKRAEMEATSVNARAVELEAEVDKLTQERDDIAKRFANEKSTNVIAFNDYMTEHAKTTQALESEQARVAELQKEVEEVRKEVEEVRKEVEESPSRRSGSSPPDKKFKADGDDDGWVRENIQVATGLIQQDRKSQKGAWPDMIPENNRMLPATLIHVASGGQEYHLGCIKDVRQAAVCTFDVIVDCMGRRKLRELHPKLQEGSTRIFVFAWNHESGRLDNAQKLMAILKHPRARKILFFCKMGERRSAAVCAVSLCAMQGFTPRAAKSQIEDLRKGAMLSEEATSIQGHTYSPEFPQVQWLARALTEKHFQSTGGGGYRDRHQDRPSSSRGLR